MKIRILTLIAAMMMFSSVAFAHQTGGSINGLSYAADGPKIAIYTQEGYSVGNIIESQVDSQPGNGDVLQAVDGYLTQAGTIRVYDMAKGSTFLVEIVETHMSADSALYWLGSEASY